MPINAIGDKTHPVNIAIAELKKANTVEPDAELVRQIEEAKLKTERASDIWMAEIAAADEIAAQIIEKPASTIAGLLLKLDAYEAEPINVEAHDLFDALRADLIAMQERSG